MRQDALFELVKSLTKSEKRFIKLSANLQSGEKNYLRLFEYLEKQSDYDEEDIAINFQGETFAKQLHVTKNYLYNFILSCLVNYSKDRSVERQLRMLSLEIEELYRKGLYTQCDKQIRRGKKLAYKYHMDHQLVDLLKWEQKVFESENRLEKSPDEELAVYDRLSNLSKFQEIKYELYRLVWTRHSKDEDKTMEKLEEVISNPFLKEENANSYQSKNTYFYIMSTYHYMAGDFGSALRFIKKLVGLRESLPQLIAEDPFEHIKTLYNQYILEKHLFLYNDCFETIERIRNIERLIPKKSTLSEKIRARIFSNSYEAELLLRIKMGRFEKSKELIEKVEFYLDEYRDIMQPASLLVFYYNIGGLFFIMADYKRALGYINKLLDLKEKGIRVDILRHAKILNLIIHYELGNHQLLEYAVKSTERDLRKHTGITPFEKALMSFLRNVALYNSRKELHGKLNELKVILTQASDNPFEQSNLQYMDFFSWIDSKLTGKPFVELVQEKALEEMKQSAK